MKFFEEPKLDVLKFALEDVITVSAGGGTTAAPEEEEPALFGDTPADCI